VGALIYSPSNGFFAISHRRRDWPAKRPRWAWS